MKPGESTYAFQNLGIQCVTKKGIRESLEKRRHIRVDPFQTGYDHGNDVNNINLNEVKLCFQVRANYSVADWGRALFLSVGCVFLLLLLLLLLFLLLFSFLITIFVVASL